MSFDVSEEWVLAAEAALGTRLPPAYRNALLANNGGEIEAAEEAWEAYAVLDRTDRRRLARSSIGLVAETQASRAWPLFPAGAIAIADNGSGDRLVLLHANGRCGHTVHRRDHETGELRVIASSFDELTIR